MNEMIWGWVLVGALAVLSVFMMLGKASFLIAGYNTASKHERARYDAKKLSRVVGVGFAVITAIVAVDLAYKFELPSAISWLVPWGYLVVLGLVVVLSNTACRAEE